MIFTMIMAGGSGTRFWPLSMEARPKQFLPIGTKQPLLRATAERVLPLSGWEGLLVVASQKYAGSIRRILPELPNRNLLIEPRPRNTAPAIGLAALEVLSRQPDGILVVLPSDHIIRPAGRFRKLVRAACRQAQTGALITLGVVASRPETGYGYIQAGEQLGQVSEWPVYQALGFTEKPDQHQAQEYLRAGCYTWNSGMFIFRADAIMRAFESHMPKLHAGLFKAHLAKKKERSRIIAHLFKRLEAESIDYGVMEKASNIQMLPCDCFWSDVGSWAALPEVVAGDDANNLINGDVLALDSKGCVLHSEKRLVACVGLKDMVVVETPQAILVCPIQEAQRVKQIVQELRDKRRKDVL